MVAPALSTIAAEFNVDDEIVSQLMLSIFILAYAIGPLIMGPLSEIYGRVIVLQLANLFYLVFNVACGVSQTKVQMIVCRFFSGLGGSAPLAVSCPHPRYTSELTTPRSAQASYLTASELKNAAKASQSTVSPPS